MDPAPIWTPALWVWHKKNLEVVLQNWPVTGLLSFFHTYFKCLPKDGPQLVDSFLSLAHDIAAPLLKSKMVLSSSSPDVPPLIFQLFLKVGAFAIKEYVQGLSHRPKKCLWGCPVLFGGNHVRVAGPFQHATLNQCLLDWHVLSISYILPSQNEAFLVRASLGV